MNQENCSSCPTTGKRHWMWLVLIALVLLALALYVTFKPFQSYVGLSVVFGWAFIITGISKIFISLYRHSVMSGWGWYLAYGVISLVLGIYLAANIILTMEVLPVIFAFWLLLQGSFLISNSISMRHRGGWGWILTGGILIVIVSFFLLFNPVLSFLSLIVWMGIGLYVASAAYFMMAVNTKRCSDKPQKA